ncbi:FUSC family protein [Blastococcus sp. PRF04-17]|uniref:FUSC family protein n=1 Tax=Blastococcus sp. PRF04-17 TaxID=2933797 RepID=UPI001FF1527E|nr:FUSC family protein [Blastococcus sp. PRF04-17]UOY01655.1 FUSC family protein [Blastococcus sp. PRF04-17]
MGRVRLTAGGVSPGQVRLKPSGASERLRRPGDDINYTTRPGEKCRVCGRRAAVPESGRSRLCQVCTPDGRIVAEVTAALKAAGQPPLSAAVPAGAPLRKLRTRGLQAKARLDERRRQHKDVTPPAEARRNSSARVADQAPRPARRLSAQDKQAGVRRLRARITSIERQLNSAGALRPHARARLEEELGAARRLLSRWNDTR